MDNTTLRANLPVDDFGVLSPLEEATPEEKITKEELELAKIGKSPNWKIIKDYLESRVEAYQKGLFGEDLTGKDASTIGNRFLAAQSVVSEFTKLIDEIERSVNSVDEVANAAKRRG